MFSEGEMEARVDQMEKVAKGELGGRGNCGCMYGLRGESIFKERN